MNTAIISLIIMGICIILFITELLPSATTAMLGCCAMVIFGVCSLSDIMSGFAGDICLLVFGMQIIGTAMFSSGAAAMIGNAAVKLSNNNERRFIFIACIIAAVMSAFLSNTAVIAMMLAVSGSIANISKNIKYKNIVLPIAIAAMFGGQCTLVGSTPQLVASGILSDATGSGLGMFSLAYVGVPLTLLMILYMTFFGYRHGEKIWGKRADENPSSGTQIPEAADKKKAVVVFAIFALVIVLFFTPWITPGVAAVIGAILCIATGSVKQKEAFHKLDWNVLIWLCCCLGLGTALNVGGGAKLISSFLLNLFNGASAYLFFAAIVLIVMVLSQFISNTAAIVIILPTTLSTAIAMGINPYLFCYAVSFGAALTFITPLANGFVGLTLTAGYRFTDYVRYGLFPSLVTYGLVVGISPLFFPL